MSKNQKQAEKALIDADKFPVESLRERLARRYGLDAVALSGPCEGQPLVECIVKQLEKRWDNIKSRFAGNVNDKVQKVATFLAESYMRKDDTDKCIKDLESLGYGKEAASGITNYLKAYAMGPAGNMEMEMAMDSATDPVADATPDMGGGDSDPMSATPSVDVVPDAGGEMPPVGDAAPEPAGGLPPPDMGGDLGGDLGAGGDAGMVTIDIPMDVAQQIADQVNGGGDMGAPDMGGGDMPPGDDLSIEVVDVTDGDVPGGDLHGEGDDGMGDVEEVGDEIVPGEPAGGSDDHMVEGNDIEEASAGGHKCSQCGHLDQEHEKQEEKAMGNISKGLDQFEKAEETEHEKHESSEKKEAGNMRKGHLRRVAEQVLKIGPEMSINNTDQLGGHDDKKLGTAKEKTVEEPKPLHDGNVETEGYSAGDKKYQDKATMGHEQAFDAKEFDKGSATGGKSSIMGKDESFPEGKPQVPAGSAPIGGEVWEGGNLATKGTVIATITPAGVLVEADGKKYIAKGTISKAMVPAIQAGLAKIQETDGRKFASAAKALLVAETSGKVDNVTKIDTSKLEAEKFTNDGDKKPAEGGAMTGKGKAHKDEEHPTTDTSKKEAEHFQNDAEKKPEKDAATGKGVKVAKPVEDPKPIADGNLDTEGYSAGDKKFQDGGTMGHEEKFDAKSVEKSDVSGGESSLIGKDEELPKGKPDVPAGGGKMGHEEFDGGNLKTKGTTIAENQAQNREAAGELQSKLNEAQVERQRLLAASVYVADLLRHGEITEADYTKELEKTAKMSVPMIQNLIASTRKTRERVVAAAARAAKVASSDPKSVGLTVPVVHTSEKHEQQLSLKERLVAAMKMTKDLDRLDEMQEPAK